MIRSEIETMSLTIEPPVYDFTERCNTFTFSSAPTVQFTIENTVGNSSSGKNVKCELIPSPDAVESSEDVSAVIHHFISASSRYFSSKLDSDIFKRRLKHTWEDANNYIDISSIPRSFISSSLTVTWIPAYLVMYHSFYKLFWRCVDVIPIMNPGNEETASEQIQELPVPTEVDGESIPLDSGPVVLTAKERARQKLRQARLRVALAELRAEKLAMKYYKKYGILHTGTNLLDTSSDSDSEKQGEEAVPDSPFSDGEIQNALNEKI